MVKFAILARALGVEQFGLYNAMLGLMAFVSPFAGWGFNSLLFRYVTRDKFSFPLWWGNALTVIAISGSLLAIAVTASSQYIVPQSTLLLSLLLGVMQLITSPMSDVVERAFRARYQMRQAAWISTIPQILAFLALFGFLSMSEQTALTWAAWSLLASAIGTAILVVVTSVVHGSPKPNLRAIADNWVMGMHFAVGQSASSIYSSIDRVMLARFGTLSDTGVYAAAMTILGMAKLPLSTLEQITHPKFYELGGQSVIATARFAWKNVKLGTVYAMVAGAGLILLSPLVPVVLGSSYESSVGALRWCAIFPLLSAIGNPARVVITAIDRPQDRTKILMVAALMNTVLNFMWIPRYGWRGAIASTVLCEVILVIALWGVILVHAHREHQNGTATTPPRG